MIKLGQTATDTITGFQGIVLSRTLFLHGCCRVRIQPEGLTGDGKPKDDAVFDELALKENTSERGPIPEILGQIVIDTVSGIEGTCIGYTEYLHNQPRVGIQKHGADDKGTPFESFSVDLAQVKWNLSAAAQPEKRKGGPGKTCDPPKMNSRD